jgi:hypothetical protein
VHQERRRRKKGGRGRGGRVRGGRGDTDISSQVGYGSSPSDNFKNCVISGIPNLLQYNRRFKIRYVPSPLDSEVLIDSGIVVGIGTFFFTYRRMEGARG